MVKLVVYDFDGVLTDNRVWVSQDAQESVACNRADGLWINEIRKLGIGQMILSTETNPVVQARAKKIGLPVIQGVEDKLAVLRAHLAKEGLSFSDICYVGNDCNDLACLEAAGVSMAPLDSHPEVLRVARVPLAAMGGAGVVRHVHDWLKRAQIKTSEARAGKAVDLLRLALQRQNELLEDGSIVAALEEAAEACRHALTEGRKVIFAGLGANAPIASLLAEAFTKRFPRPTLTALALGRAASLAQEVSTFGGSGDVLIVLASEEEAPALGTTLRASFERKLRAFVWSSVPSSFASTLLLPEAAEPQESFLLLGNVLVQLVEGGHA